MLNQELNLETNQELNLQHPFSDQTAEQETMQPLQPLADKTWLTDQLNDELEDAVERACAPLIGTVPRKDLLVRRAAMRAELDALLVAHRELEVVPERAVSDAIAHFQRLHPIPTLAAQNSQMTTLAQVGMEQHLATAQIAMGQTETVMTANQMARPAMLLTLGLLGPFYLIHAAGLTNFLHDRFPTLEYSTMYRVELFLVPLLAGLLVGNLTPKKAVRGTLLGIGLLSIYAVLIPSLIMGLSFTSLFFGGDATPNAPDNPLWTALWRIICPDMYAGFSGVTLWLLMASSGAAITSRLRTRRRRGNDRG